MHSSSTWSDCPSCSMTALWSVKDLKPFSLKRGMVCLTEEHCDVELEHPALPWILWQKLLHYFSTSWETVLLVVLRDICLVPVSSKLCLKRWGGFCCVRPVTIGTGSALCFLGMQVQHSIIDKENSVIHVLSSFLLIASPAFPNRDTYCLLLCKDLSFGEQYPWVEVLPVYLLSLPIYPATDH